MHMVYAWIFGKFSAYRIHGDDIFRVIVFDGGKISELSADSIIRSKKVGYLHIKRFIPCY